MNIRQGDIFWADLNPVKGHEQAGLRPVMILQNNILNKNLNTVVIAPITTQLKAKGKMTTFFLPARTSGLQRDSVALLFQVRTIDIRRLQKRISTMSKEDMKLVKEQLWYVF